MKSWKILVLLMLLINFPIAMMFGQQSQVANLYELTGEPEFKKMPSGEWMLIPPEGLGSLQDGIVPSETVMLFLFPEWVALSNKLLNQRLNMATTIAMPFEGAIADKDNTIEIQKKRIGELESGSVLVPVLVGASSVVVGAAVGVIIGIIVAN